MKKTFIKACAIACGWLVWHPAAFAEDCVWQGSATARWNDPSSWTDGRVPDSQADIVRISGGDAVVTDDDAAIVATVGAIVLDSAGSRLVFNNDGDINVNGCILGAGSVLKLGSGTVFYNAVRLLSVEDATQAHDYSYEGGTVISNGMIRLQDCQAHSGMHCMFSGMSVWAPGTLAMPLGNAITILNGPLTGNGTITNLNTSGGPYQLRLDGPGGEFLGKITGRIRLYSQGSTMLTGTENDFPCIANYDGAFAIRGGGPTDSRRSATWARRRPPAAPSRL